MDIQKPRPKNVKQFCISYWPSFGFNYIGIPKTGSSSILTSLLLESKIFTKKYVNAKENNVESHSSQYVTYINPQEAIDNKLPLVISYRCPKKRFLSLYRDFSFGYKSKNHKISGSKFFKFDYMQYKNSNKDIDNFLDLFCKYTDEDVDVHFRKQTWFINNLKNCKNIMYINTENLYEDLQDLNKKFNLRLKYYKKNVSPPNNIILSKKQKEKLKIFLKEDFELWNVL